MSADALAAAFVAASPTRYAREPQDVPAASLHPELRFTRLGAVLRQLASSGEDDTAANLARSAIAADHAQPLDLMPLHALRDFMLENPEHLLAKRFNWERLPEKVALDATVRDAPLVHGLGWNHLVNPNDGNRVRSQQVFDRIRSKHPWASVADVQESVRRNLARHDRWRHNGDGRSGDVHAEGAADSTPPSPEHYAAKSQPVRYAKSKRNRVHPLLRGTRLAVVLKEIAADKTRPQTAAFAKSMLYDEHGPTQFAQFADHLRDIEHPLLDHYNWPAVTRKLLHDDAAFETIKRITREEQRRHEEMGIATSTPRQSASGIIGNVISGTSTFAHERQRLADAVRRADRHATDAEVDEALLRVRHRIQRIDRRKRNDRFLEVHERVERDTALRSPAEAIAQKERAHLGSSLITDPERQKQNAAAAVAEEKALRYDRQRVGGVKNALRLMQSRNQKQYHEIVGGVLAKLGLKPAKLRDGVVLSGAPISSVVAAIYHDASPALAEAAAAYFGHLSQLPSVTAFHAASDGPDSLYKLSLALAPAAAAQHLQRHGIGRAVLVPNGSRTDVLIHDPGRRQAAKVASAADGGEVQETVGRSVRLGHADGHRADAAARKSYRSVISAFESAINGSRQQPAADRDGASARAAAGAEAAAATAD